MNRIFAKGNENYVKKGEFMSPTVDTLVFYDNETKRIIAMSAANCRERHFEKRFIIEKVAEINMLGKVLFVNVEEFEKENPNSCIRAYMNGKHSERVLSNFDKYVASYIHLYRVYKSLAILSRSGFTELVDSFIEDCCSSGTDHPSTIGYFGNQLNEALRLNVGVFKLFGARLKDYEFYTKILTLHKNCQFKEKDLRVLKNSLKKSEHSVAIRVMQNVCKIAESELAMKPRRKVVFDKLLTAALEQTNTVTAKSSSTRTESYKPINIVNQPTAAA